MPCRRRRYRRCRRSGSAAAEARTSFSSAWRRQRCAIISISQFRRTAECCSSQRAHRLRILEQTIDETFPADRSSAALHPCLAHAQTSSPRSIASPPAEVFRYRGLPWPPLHRASGRGAGSPSRIVRTGAAGEGSAARRRSPCRHPRRSPARARPPSSIRPPITAEHRRLRRLTIGVAPSREHVEWPKAGAGGRGRKTGAMASDVTPCWRAHTSAAPPHRGPTWKPAGPAASISFLAACALATFNANLGRQRKRPPPWRVWHARRRRAPTFRRSLNKRFTAVPIATLRPNPPRRPTPAACAEGPRRT